MGLKNFPGFQPAQTSVLRTVDEPKLKKKKFNWDRVIFMLILGFVAWFIGNRLYRNYGQIEVNGQVILDKMMVNFTDNIRVKRMMVEAGDHVEAGDSLFSYVMEINGQENLLANSFNQYDGNENWFFRERLALTRQINLKDSEKAGIRTLIRIKERELEEMRKRVYLGAALSHKIDPLEEEIQELNNDLDSKNSEVRVLRNHLELLHSQEKIALAVEKNKMKTDLEAFQGFNNLIVYYTTPISGLVGQIEKQPNEVCYLSENVMTIHQLFGIRVKAYFDPRHADDVKIGDELLLKFDDGRISRGIVKSFYVSTYPLPPEFQVKYEPVTRSLVADVAPVTEAEAQSWLSYYKLSVKVVKKRISWL